MILVGGALLSATSCARGIANHIDDAGPADAPRPIDATIDAMTHLDAMQLTADAPPVCAISTGVTPNLTGTNDLAAYPSAQHLAPGAMLGTDAAAIAWDRDRLYITMTSSAFAGAYEPLHVYVQAMQEIAAAVPAMGKEYSGLVPALPFSPSYLIAIRRVDDAGTGSYDGVYTPSGAWSTRTTVLAPMVSADGQTLSVAVPWTALSGCPTSLRLALHVVHAVAANEWKDLVPTTTTPWQAPGGGYYEIDLTGASAVASWILH